MIIDDDPAYPAWLVYVEERLAYNFNYLPFETWKGLWYENIKPRADETAREDDKDLL
jgi:hypothetical protein